MFSQRETKESWNRLLDIRRKEQESAAKWRLQCLRSSVSPHSGSPAHVESDYESPSIRAPSCGHTITNTELLETSISTLSKCAGILLNLRAWHLRQTLSAWRHWRGVVLHSVSRDDSHQVTEKFEHTISEQMDVIEKVTDEKHKIEVELKAALGVIKQMGRENATLAFQVRNLVIKSKGSSSTSKSASM